MITLDQLAQEVQDLAPLPAAAAKLAKIVSEKDPDVGDVVTAIKYDQALTARILRYANSPMAGSLYKIQSVKDAVIRLGFAKVLEITVSSHVKSSLQKSLPEYGLGEEELWFHSVASALAAESLQQRTKDKLPATSFTAALLHDIGKLILARHLDPQLQQQIHRHTDDYSTTYYQAEQDVLGFTHADLGAKVVLRWGLGDDIAQAVERHHGLSEDEGPTTDVVRICNLVAKTIGSGLGYEGMNLIGDPGACERLGIGRTAYEGLCAEVATLLLQFQEWAA